MNSSPRTPMTTTLHLDTRFDIHATNPDGSLMLDGNQQPIQIAQDLITGAWFAKVRDSMPHRNTTEHKAALDVLTTQGAVHSPHDNERFRGVWIPLDALESDDYDAEFDDANGDGDGEPHELAAGEQAALPAPRRTPAKHAAKHPAKKAAKRVN